jgi:hypothetical protein
MTQCTDMGHIKLNYVVSLYSVQHISAYIVILLKEFLNCYITIVGNTF